MQIKDLEPFLPEMITLPIGQFLMGASQDEVWRGHHKSVPQHMVRFDYEFAVGKYPVTFDQWDACVKDGGTTYIPADKGWGRGSRPVINVSWDDIQLYLRWLSKVTGETYRLLSEAEWEYAARAGSQTAYSFGDDEKELGRYAWFEGNSGEKTHPVGKKLPNAFGLYDMHGNVSEITQDVWRDNYNDAPTDGSANRYTEDDELAQQGPTRALRGGSWGSEPRGLRAAYREWVFESGAYPMFGFRVVRTHYHVAKTD